MPRHIARCSVSRFLCRALSVCAATMAIAGYPGHAAAAGMDCSRAASKTETAICADASLRGRDAQLSAVYGRLAAALLPAPRGTLKETQTAWLADRDRCGADTSCLGGRYDERLSALRVQLRDALAYRPDETDRQALDDLRAAVEAARSTDAEFPLDDAIEHLRIKTGTVSFSNNNDGSDASDGQDADAHFPRTRPPGVSADEWRALVASKIDGGGEHGQASYTLLDVDGDGHRDLVIDSYQGGTGLFSYVSVLRRVGDRFVDLSPTVAKTAASADSGTDDPLQISQSALYWDNGRGANQSADWIRLRGRVYAAWRNSEYGADHVYLLRPLTVIGNVPTLTVGYRYVLSIPKAQKNDEKGTTTVLDESLHAALTRALARVDHEVARDAGSGTPLCPIPDTVKGDDRDAYNTYGPGHYTFEIVGDMPVWIGKRCYIGRVVDWFGGYSRKDGLFAQLWMRTPAVDTDEGERQYTVHGVRTTIRVDTSIGKVVGDNS